MERGQVLSSQNEIKNNGHVLLHVVMFFVFAYLWSWAWWFPVVEELSSVPQYNLNNAPGWLLPFVLIGGYGPSLGACVMSLYTNGLAGLKRLLSRLILWRAPWLLHAAIWFAPSLIIIVSIFITPGGKASLGVLDWTQLQLIPMALLTGLMFGPIAEELGWRGFALPVLQKKYSALTSSLIIGVVWCFWHTPLFWAPVGTLVSGQEVTFIAVGKYLLFATGLSIVFTWIFNSSNGSVLLTIAFHAVVNASFPLLLFPARTTNSALAIQWYSIIPLWLFAILLIAIYGRTHLQMNKEEER